MNIQVSLSSNLPEPLTYSFQGNAESVRPGTRVLVPLGFRLVSGWVVSTDSSYRGKTKAVAARFGNGFFPDEYFQRFAAEVALQYRISIGSLFELALPPDQKSWKQTLISDGGEFRSWGSFSREEIWNPAPGIPRELHFPDSPEMPPSTPPPPDGFQESEILTYNHEELYQQMLAPESLPQGITLLLVPDRATASYWGGRFPSIRLYHSQIPVKDRNRLWKDIQQGNGGIVCGSRSALFLPLPGLSRIILDRSGGSGYHPTFHSGLEIPRIAHIRASCCRVPLIRIGASHTADTFFRRETIHLRDLRPESKPPISVSPLKKGKRGIPSEVLETIAGLFYAQKKIWVIANRGSGLRYPYCPVCEKTVPCLQCGQFAALTSDGRLHCLSCGAASEADIACPVCQKPLLSQPELNIGGLAESLARIIGAESIHADIPRSSRKPAEADIYSDIPVIISSLRTILPSHSRRFDAILFLRPESLFHLNRFRSAEQIFCTLQELRGALKKDGEIHVYSTFHFHYSLQWLDSESDFWERELKYRNWFHLPPYADLYLLEMKNRSLRELARQMREIRAEKPEDIFIRRQQLASRRPGRGYFRGIMELHGKAEAISRWKPHAQKDLQIRSRNE